MTAACPDRILLVDSDVDLLAIRFLDSDYAGSNYATWPIDRRIEGFLRNRGMARVADDGDTVRIVLGRVMTYMSVRAENRRDGAPRAR